MDVHDQNIDSKNVTSESMAHQNQSKMNVPNSLDFSSNIDKAKKSMAKVIKYRFEKLSTFFSSQTKLN
jgi:hypothetical protein